MYCNLQYMSSMQLYSPLYCAQVAGEDELACLNGP